MTDAPTRKTPAERAEAEYDLANKAVEKAEKRAAKTADDAKRAEADLKRAQHRRSTAASHPDLPEGVAATETIDSEPSDADVL